MMKKKVIFIVGPTAVGKTVFSIELAKGIAGEIISCDSMQAYRGMDIISQKPTPEQQRLIRHHLIDILDITEEYSAANFVRRASLVIEDIINRGKLPIVVGGSGFYIKALVDGLFPAPSKDPYLRYALELETKTCGRENLYSRLKKVDPQAASSIHPNDLRRIIRALEVFYLTGIPVSEHKKNTEGISSQYNIYIYGLYRPRAVLYKRIEERVDKMLKDGLIDEVRNISQKNPSLTARASLGYKEILGFLDKRYPIEEGVKLLKRNTRHLAKKQMTWFRRDKRISWIDLHRFQQEKVVKDLIKILKDS